MRSVINQLVVILKLLLLLSREIATVSYCAALSPSQSRSSATKVQIQVCQNKDCQKRFQTYSPGETLVQTFHDLLPPRQQSSLSDSSRYVANKEVVSIESAGCLGKCGNGPNVCCIRNGVGGNAKKVERIFTAVEDALMASVVLEVGGDFDSPDTLLVAVDSIAKATRATTLEKKIKILTRVVKSLLSDSTLCKSTALAHALVLRADAYLEQIPPSSSLTDNNLEVTKDAYNDVQKAIEINHYVDDGRAYRILADVQELSGNVLGAMEAVTKWAEVNPSFRTKAKKELARLSAVSSISSGSGSSVGP